MRAFVKALQIKTLYAYLSNRIDEQYTLFEPDINTMSTAEQLLLQNTTR